MRPTPLSVIAPRPLVWLWPGYLPLAKLALLEGDPGLGKSLLAADLAARVTNGRAWPGESAPAEAGNVVLLSAEDNPADTLRPRLQSFGADLQRVFILTGEEDRAAAVRLPTHLQPLMAACADVRPRLLIVDPINAFLDSSVFTGSDTGIRRVLSPLADLAERFGCTVLLLRHLTKKSASQSLYRGAGSIGLIGACRAAFLVAHEPHEPARCVLAQIKNNLGTLAQSLTYEIDKDVHGAPAVHWLGPSAWTAEGLCAREAGTRNRADRESACTFLKDFLGARARTSREIWRAARQQGIARATLFRAKTELKVRTQRVGPPGQQIVYWLTAGQTAPEMPDFTELIELFKPHQPDQADESLDSGEELENG